MQPRMLFAGAVALGAMLGAQAPAVATPPAAGMQRFASRTRTFHIDVPEGWRQISPGDASLLRHSHPDWPREVLFTEPGQCYAVGPIDAWLRGDFAGVFLYVVEQGNEWHTPDQDLTRALQQLWDRAGREQGLHFEVVDAKQVTVGTEDYEAIQCQRRRIPNDKGVIFRSLDTYVATGGRELSLALCCPEDRFVGEEPRFRQMLSTLTLARRAHGKQTLADRIWTPILTSAAVCLGLWALYRWTRRRV